jgi:hypothetical protein
MARTRKIDSRGSSRRETQARKTTEPEAAGREAVEPEIVEREVAQPEAARSTPESETVRTVAPSASAVQPNEVKSEGDKMQQTDKGSFEDFSELARGLFSFDGARKLAAFYIDSGEKLAKSALDLQAKSTEWAKDVFALVSFERVDGS